MQGVTYTLQPCGNKPNCVSSLAEGKSPKLKPWVVGPTEGAPKVIAQVAALLGKQKHVSIVKITELYLHLVYTSSLFRFKDDVEFLHDVASGLLHFRSASRLGYYDFRANLNRYHTICGQFETTFSWLSAKN